MARYHGKIGFIKTMEDPPDSGIWKTINTEREYFGDVLRDTRRWSTAESKVNDDLTINNRLSIVADNFANENFGAMKYAIYMNQKWKITEVEVQYPRLLLTLGGLYNGETT